MLRHLFSDPYVCTIVITHAIYSIKNIVLKKKEKKKKKKKDCSCIFASIARLRQIHRFSFVFSGCIKTCNDSINFRISEVNTFARNLCIENKFLFIDHSNISSQELKDFVHLNDIGEKTFVEILRRFLQ